MEQHANADRIRYYGYSRRSQYVGSFRVGLKYGDGMGKQGYIEIIARGVCVKDGKVLLCFGRKSGIAYLPGGHIDFGESGRQALEREIDEEMGLISNAGQFLGCCEHWFLQSDKRHAEINLVYNLDVPELDPDQEPEALEGWIGFMWHPLKELGDVNFEPAELGGCLEEWLAQPGGHLECGYLQKRGIDEKDYS